MIKKVKKSFDNPYGISDVDTNPFDKPCILGVFSETQNKTMLNGYLNTILLDDKVFKT